MTWCIVQVTSGREEAAGAILDRLGYPGAWYPTRKVQATSRLRQKRATTAPRYVQRAWVPGYLFLPTTTPEHHVINGTHGRLWMRLITPGGEVYRVQDRDMARMQDVPKRVQELVDEARRKEQEAWQAVCPEVGKRAKLVSGPFMGAQGVVISITDGEVVLDCGVPIRAPLENAQKVA